MKTLLIDIETAPAKAYIWDLKTRYVPLSQVAKDGHVLCFAAGWLGEDHVYFSSRWDHGEKAMVQTAWDLLKYRLGPPRPAHQIDLYRTVSGQFRVLSKSLKHMLSILSLENKLEHKGMELWTGVMAGNKEDQKIMEEYNIRDISTLEPLYYELLPWIKGHPNVGLWMEPADVPLCTHCGSSKLRFKGYKRTSVLSYKQYQCQNCLTWNRERYSEEVGENRRKDILR
jgi:hypothetical protein